MIDNLEELERREAMLLLNNAKIPCHWRGYKYIVTSIPIVIENLKAEKNLTLQEIYKEIAQKHKTTVTKVEAAIRYIHDNTNIKYFLGYEKISNKVMLYNLAENIILKLRI